MPRKVGTPWKIDLSGSVFGRWLVLGRTKGANWRCLCACGVQKAVQGSSLKLGKSVSCGCFAREMNTTHGMEGTSVYAIWAGMKQRCSNPNSSHYADYGGRGIRVCEQWQTFEGFYADMGDRPKGMSIDRYPDNDGNYEPGNVRWANPTMQIRNRSTTVKIGDEAAAAIAERHGISIKRFRDRVQSGITGDELLSTEKLTRWR